LTIVGALFFFYQLHNAGVFEALFVEAASLVWEIARAKDARQDQVLLGRGRTTPPLAA